MAITDTVGTQMMGQEAGGQPAPEQQPTGAAPTEQPTGQPAEQQAVAPGAQPAEAQEADSGDEESSGKAPSLATSLKNDPSIMKAIQAYQRFAGMSPDKAVEEMRKPQYGIPGDQVNKIVQMFGGQDNLYRIARERRLKEMQEEADLKAKAKVAEVKATKEAEKEAAEPEDKKLAHALASGKMVDLYKVVSMRSDRRARIFDMASEENSEFNPEDSENKINVWKDWNTSRGLPFKQKYSANVLFDHIGDAIEANEKYRRINSNLLGKPMSWWSHNMAQDPAYQKLRVAIQPVKHEFMTFLLNNHALTESDRQAGDVMASENLSPEFLEGALKQFAVTAAYRLRELNDQGWKPAFGSDYPNLLTESAVEAIRKMNTPELLDILGDMQAGGTVTGSATGEGKGGKKLADLLESRDNPKGGKMVSYKQQGTPQTEQKQPQANIPPDANVPQGGKPYMSNKTGAYLGYVLDNKFIPYKQQQQSPQGNVSTQ